MARKDPSSSSPPWVARTELLLELVRLDTAYGDLYRQRARQIAASELSGSDFKALKNAEQSVEELPGDIRRAMDDGKWEQVKKLTDELGSKQRFVQERGSLHKIGERLYEDEAIHVDPFSPGFYWYHRREERQLPALRADALAKLVRAAEIDPEWKALYQERAKALKAVQLADPSAAAGEAKGRGQMEQRARDALAAGNLEELQKLAGTLQQGGSEQSGPATVETTEDLKREPLS